MFRRHWGPLQNAPGLAPGLLKRSAVLQERSAAAFRDSGRGEKAVRESGSLSGAVEIKDSQDTKDSKDGATRPCRVSLLSLKSLVSLIPTAVSLIPTPNLPRATRGAPL